jgi:hypothetical protein
LAIISLVFITDFLQMYDAIIDEYLFCNSQVALHVYNVQSSYQSISIFYQVVLEPVNHLWHHDLED